MTGNDVIQAPIIKAVTAIGMGAGSSVTSLLAQDGLPSFLPTDLAGWMAVLASAIACAYTLTLWGEWWWKKFWKPFLRRKNWLRYCPRWMW